MTSPPIISYATESGDQLSIVQLDDGGVDVHVPPQGWLWFTRGRRWPIVGIMTVLAALAGVWVFLVMRWRNGDRTVAYVLPVAVLQAAFIAFAVVRMRAAARKRVRITATRNGLWVRTTGASSAPLERFFPIERIGDVDIKWSQSHGRGAMTVALRGSGHEQFLDHCRGKDVVEVVNHVRRALRLWPRSYKVPTKDA